MCEEGKCSVESFSHKSRAYFIDYEFFFFFPPPAFAIIFMQDLPPITHSLFLGVNELVYINKHNQNPFWAQINYPESFKILPATTSPTSMYSMD